MKRTTWLVLANLMGIGLLLGGQAIAQQISPATGGQPLVPQLDSAFSDGSSVGTVEQTNVIPPGAYPQGSMIALDGSSTGAAPTYPGCVVCGGGDCIPPKWYTIQDLQVLSLSGPRRKQLSREFSTSFINQFNPTGLQQRLSTRSVIPDVAAGYHGALGRYLGRDTEGRDHFLEFSYWGLNKWDQSRETFGTRLTFSETIENPAYVPPVDPPDPHAEPAFIQEPRFTGGSLFSYFDSSIGGFNRADVHSITYQAEVHNWELNLRLRPRDPTGRLVMRHNRWRRECKPSDRTAYLFGFRVFSLDEHFAFRSRGLITDPAGGNPAPTTGDYLSSTRNDLFGIQIGLQHVVRRCKWTWGLKVKASPLINFSDYAIAAASDSAAASGLIHFATSDVNFRRSAKGDEVALLGELGIFASYKIRPNLALRASYDLTWITGLARAPEQLDFNTLPVTRLNNNGHIFSQGLTLGTEWLF